MPLIHSPLDRLSGAHRSLGSHRTRRSAASDEPALCRADAVPARGALSAWRSPWWLRRASRRLRSSSSCGSDCPICPCTCGAMRSRVSFSFCSAPPRPASPSSPPATSAAARGPPPGLLCLQYHLFLASMGFVLLADDAYAFMVAWETMALSSYFLVTTQHGLPEIRRAGFLYLLIAHVGAIAILLSFGVMQGGSWQFTFDAMRARAPRTALGSDRFPARSVWLRGKGGARAAARVAARGTSRGALARLGAHERSHAEDGRLRRAACHLRSAGKARMVVGSRAARHRALQRAVRRRVCRGADRHEAAARVVLDREHRHHLHRARACDRVPRRRHARARRAGTDRRCSITASITRS